MPVTGDELDKHLKMYVRNATRSSETAATVTFGGTISGTEMRNLIDVLDSQGWHMELVAGALVAKVGKG